MVERSLVAARITAKIDSVVKDEPTSRLLPRRLEDQDLPREYLERGQGHYVPPMIHLMAYTINITSSYRRLDANSCLEAPLKTKVSMPVAAGNLLCDTGSRHVSGCHIPVQNYLP